MEEKAKGLYTEMDFFSRILNLGEKLGQKKIYSEPSSECRKLHEFQEKIDSLLAGKNYVARSDYSELIPEYKETVEFFRVLQNSKMLKRYCAQNGTEEKSVLHVIELYDHLEKKIDKLNEVAEYGIYADMSRDDMRAVVQWMINNHYMLKTKAKYPVLHPTYDGNHFDECITKKQIKDLKKYLEDPNREVLEEEDSED